MELVYLWVEEYKNIKNQGFNFSPRFTCKYENGTLTIDKKEHVNIFPENINVTAIVGENGSGKTSILTAIAARNKGFLVACENNELKIYTRNMEVITHYEKKNLTPEFNKKVLYYSLDDNYLRATKRHTQWIRIEGTIQLIVQNFSKVQKINFKLYNFIPEFLVYTISEETIIPQSYSDEISQDIIESLKRETQSESDVIYNIIGQLQNIADEYILYLFQRFEDLEYLFESLNLISKIHPKDQRLELDEQEIIKSLQKNELWFLTRNEFNTIKENENKKIPINQLKNIFGENYIELLFRPERIELEFNLFAKNDATFHSLSHGEKTIYGILLHIILFNENNFLLLLDEPSNTLHPEWQRKFIGELTSLLNEYNKNAHIIISSHSPFILSDLPKENVIFLEKGKQVHPNIETFGANIHTLLSHGFFMKEGLMGEFAKEKINKAIEYLNKKELTKDETDYCENIISIIGEPILKRQLQKMLDSKRLSEIENIKKQIAELQQKLDEHQHAQN